MEQSSKQAGAGDTPEGRGKEKGRQRDTEKKEKGKRIGSRCFFWG